MAKRKYQTYAVRVADHAIPVRLYREPRRGARASIGKKAAILRLPSRLPPGEFERLHQWFEHWLHAQLTNHPELLERFTGPQYVNGQVFWVGKRQYQLNIEVADRKTYSARLEEGVIYLKLSQAAAPDNRNRAIRRLLSRVVGADFLPEITARVHQLNDRHFQQPVKAVKLKYNHSNWGSCSSGGNINLSTRLLFAPDPVIDYVIVHELAHLIEFNHSKRYWELVERAAPDYRERIKWLKENGRRCDF